MLHTTKQQCGGHGPYSREQPTNLRTIGGRIRRARIDAIMTIAEMSKRSGISHNYLSALELGNKHNPSWLMIVTLSEVLDVSFEYLAGWQEETGTCQKLMNKSPSP